MVPEAGWTRPNISHTEGIGIKQDCTNGCLYNIMEDLEERNDQACNEGASGLERNATETSNIPSHIFQS